MKFAAVLSVVSIASASALGAKGCWLSTDTKSIKKYTFNADEQTGFDKGGGALCTCLLSECKTFGPMKEDGYTSLCTDGEVTARKSYTYFKYTALDGNGQYTSDKSCDTDYCNTPTFCGATEVVILNSAGVAKPAYMALLGAGAVAAVTYML
jgi:hypothetical protein